MKEIILFILGALLTEVIELICQKLGVNYCSPHHNKIKEFKNDIQKLVDIYLQLKDIEIFLCELSNKYSDLKDLSILIKKSICEIDKVDHQIKTEAYLMKKRYENKKNKI